MKLEFGTLTDQQPTGRYPIQALIATAYPALFVDWHCEVVALERGTTSCSNVVESVH